MFASVRFACCTLAVVFSLILVACVRAAFYTRYLSRRSLAPMCPDARCVCSLFCACSVQSLVSDCYFGLFVFVVLSVLSFHLCSAFCEVCATFSDFYFSSLVSKLTRMCDCFSRLAASHVGADLGEREVLQHQLDVIMQYNAQDRLGLHQRALDFALEAFECIVLKREPGAELEFCHCCEDADRLIAYLGEVDRFHHHLEDTTYCRSPRMRCHMRRALFKNY